MRSATCPAGPVKFEQVKPGRVAMASYTGYMAELENAATPFAPGGDVRQRVTVVPTSPTSRVWPRLTEMASSTSTWPSSNARQPDADH